MSNNLFSNIYNKAVTEFRQAEGVIDGIVLKAETLPGVKVIENAVVSSVKQEISNALAFVDTELAPHFGDAVSMVESAIDTGLLAFGATVGPAGEVVIKAVTPGVNAGATMLFNQLRAVIDHAEADFKVNANLPAPTSAAQPTVASVIGAVTGGLGGAVLAAPAPAAQQVLEPQPGA